MFLIKSIARSVLHQGGYSNNFFVSSKRMLRNICYVESLFYDLTTNGL